MAYKNQKQNKKHNRELRADRERKKRESKLRRKGESIESYRKRVFPSIFD